LAGLVVYEAGVYAWHRAMHGSNVLWRAFHQLHHSAERLDTFGAFWFSPLDMLGWTALSSVCLVLLVGITPEAAVLVLYVTTFLSVFQHANVRTPRLARSVRAAAREPFVPPRARRARAQLQRLADLRLVVRHATRS
jgi:sterol desaturase/sphingolipid hydroxylase (fatty acid hydroxylase superfamily)